MGRENNVYVLSCAVGACNAERFEIKWSGNGG
jgi:hypothetical protein